MTSRECLHMIEMLLDDGLLDMAGDTEVLAAINEAQRAKIRQYYTQGEERALRPLYKTSALLDTGAAVADMLMPRSARVYEADTVPDNQSFSAVYVPYDRYLTFPSPGFGIGTGGLVHTARYTVFNNTVVFNKAVSTQRIRLYYIRTPVTFTTTQTLELPEEFHIEVIVLAASMLLDMDVNEFERGQPINPNEALPIEQLAG